MVKMKAPVGASGHIHASASGLNYEIADGHVDVDQRDVGDLIRAGYLPLSSDEIERMAAPQQTTFTQDFIGHESLQLDDPAPAAEAADEQAASQDDHEASPT